MLAREDLRRALHRQVRESVKLGARLVLGGAPLSGPGFFYAPTVLADVRKGMPAYGEELFGPVAAIIPVRDEAEAVRIGQRLPAFGLGSAVFTRSRRTAERVAARLPERRDPCSLMISFDRIRRCLSAASSTAATAGNSGPTGIREFVNIKTVLFA